MEALNGYAHLTDWGVIEAVGEDAANFLHNQLTQDLLLMKPHEARFAGYCSPKGRLLANFIAIKPNATTVLLVCPRELLSATLKRLSMFVLRAKVKLTDATERHTLLGLLGAAATATGLPVGAARWSHVNAGGEAAAQTGMHAVAHTVALYPADGTPLALYMAVADSALPDGVGAELPLATWQWALVRSGVAFVTSATADQFVPQMLNHESIGGVNFKKGCYPGQEVVARSQFRGTTKRRTQRMGCAAQLAPGQEVFTATDAEQPVGLVAQAAPRPDGTGWDALVSLQTASLAEPLHLGSSTGPALTLQPLPYELLADV